MDGQPSGKGICHEGKAMARIRRGAEAGICRGQDSKQAVRSSLEGSPDPGGVPWPSSPGSRKCLNLIITVSLIKMDPQILVGPGPKGRGMSLLKKGVHWAAEKQSSEQMGKQLREGSGTQQVVLASQPSH